MATYPRGKYWWYRFRFAGERIDEPTKSTSRTVAKEAERQHRRALEAGYNNFKEVRQNRVRILEEVIEEYLTGYRLRYRSASFAEYALGHVSRLLGTKIVGEITEISVLRYPPEFDIRGSLADESANTNLRPTCSSWATTTATLIASDANRLGDSIATTCDCEARITSKNRVTAEEPSATPRGTRAITTPISPPLATAQRIFLHKRTERKTNPKGDKGNGHGLFDYIAQACQSLAATAAPSITAMGTHIVLALATIMLVRFGVQESLASAHGGPGFSMARFLNLFMLLTFAYVRLPTTTARFPDLGSR